MKFNLKILAIIMILQGTFIFSDCSNNSGSKTAGDVNVTFLSAVQTGGESGASDSTGLTLTFDLDPTTLTADNISVAGAAKDDLSGSGAMRNLSISGITVANGEMITVTIESPDGYSITGSPQNAVVYRIVAGHMETFTADGVSFDMAYVPAGLTFPTGVADDGTATVANAYRIGETEVTYELWQKVYTWATGGSGATGAGQYVFANAGLDGDNGSRGVQHPVTTVNWRDCIVWCNALTEWYNAMNGTEYECAYTYSGAVIRDSGDGNATACDGAEADAAAKGFRLPTSDEFELAARYRDGMLWTYGDHASGDDSGACFDDDSSILGELEISTVFGDYVVFTGNSGSSTAEVKSKTANALGLYDMSGNVIERCFDLSGSKRVSRSGSWINTARAMQVGYTTEGLPDNVSNILGFRIARTY